MRSSRFAAVVAIMACLSVIAANSASASKYKVLYDFCSGAGCSDGQGPNAELVSDAAGNLFGTTYTGGANGAGVAFELVANAAKTKWKYKRIYNFCSKAGCTDGNVPSAGMIIDTAGNLYGTTSAGGVGGFPGTGIVFELIPADKKWKLKVLYTFCTLGDPCTDGAQPAYGSLTYQGASAGAPYDGTSPLYGVTVQGGAHNKGAVYELTHHGSTWSQSVAYSFCSNADCADGWDPKWSAIEDAAGHLFGTTYSGGERGPGVVYELTRSGNSWTETVLHNFCEDGDCENASGAPGSSLLIDGAGNLIDTAKAGGSGFVGVVYKIVPAGLGSTYSLLYQFCVSGGGFDCADGSNPFGNLSMDAHATIYGITQKGGANDHGALYQLSGKKEKVLHAFCSLANCADGNTPQTGPILGVGGSIFGVTFGGGANNQGTVYQLTP